MHEYKTFIESVMNQQGNNIFKRITSPVLWNFPLSYYGNFTLS